MYKVGSNVSNPTHHILLSDPDGNSIGLIVSKSSGEQDISSLRRTPIARTALKTSEGDAAYSDFNLPWTPVVQEDWTGGRAALDFDNDSTKFFDSLRAQTMYARVFAGPQETYTSGYRTSDINLPGSVSWINLTGPSMYVAQLYVPSTSFSVTTVALLVRRIGEPKGDLRISIRSDNSGNPGTELGYKVVTTSDITDFPSTLYHAVLSTPAAVTDGNDFWVVVSATDSDEKNCWAVGVDKSLSTAKKSDSGSSWENADYAVYYRTIDADSNHKIKFFQYKRQVYMVRNTGGAPKVYTNGDRGVADSNSGSLGKLIDASKTWVVNEFVGSIVMVIDGPGSSEEYPWRYITSNSATELDVSYDWLIEHTTDTEYVIINDNAWHELTGHGLTVDVTSILVVNDIVYFTQGDDVAIRRMQWTAASGYEWSADGPKAYVLTTVDESTGIAIWRAQNNDTNGDISVSKSAVKDWGTNLSFGTEAPFYDNNGKITNIAEGPGSTRYLWVFREGSVFSDGGGGSFVEIPLREIRTLMSEKNGIAVLRHNVYMFFNLGSGLERYLDGALDDVGPNRDEGLPSGRKGVITSMLGYPGKLFASVDAEDGYSSINAYNYIGWHELYRCPKAGASITDMSFQTIPGSAPDRMWVAIGDDVIFLPFPSLTFYPNKDDEMTYTHEFDITSGWHYAKMFDVQKYFRAIKIFAENLSSGSVYVCVDFQVDTDDGWYTVDDVADVSPMGDEIVLSSPAGLNGKRFRYRLRAFTENNKISAELRSVVTDVLSRVPVKYGYSAPVRIVDNDVDLCGNPDDMKRADDKRNLLDYWAENAIPLSMKCILKAFDEKSVILDPAEVAPMAEMDERYIHVLSMVPL